jgi:hypothetical protein
MGSLQGKRRDQPQQQEQSSCCPRAAIEEIHRELRGERNVILLWALSKASEEINRNSRTAERAAFFILKETEEMQFSKEKF